MPSQLLRAPLLLTCLFALLVVSPLLVELGTANIVSSALWALVVIACAIYASSKLLYRLIAISMAIVWLVLTFFPYELLHPAVASVLAVVLIFFTAAIVLVNIFQTAEVDNEVLSAAVAVYLLIGTGFASGYTALFQLQPNAFAIDSLQADHISIDFIYYSFVTLTTLGYGDILPLSPVAKMLSAIEAIIGGLYLTVLVARLVSLYSSAAQNDTDQSIS